ncbi:MAG: OmpA family protein [Polyangiaceae bacterium]|nr:OmpA family protein [Polyangiaceae bacterium]
MARKKKHPEHVNHERWLISYADFITLLFAFFVVMFAVSQVDSGKLGRFTESFTGALDWQVFDARGGDGLLEAKRRNARAGSKEGEEKRAELAGIPPLTTEFDFLRQALGERSGAVPELRGLEVVEVRGELILRLPDRLLFESGSADPSESGARALLVIADVVRDRQVDLRIEGHTDDRPITNARFPTNWELSAARASSVVRALVDQGHIDGSRLSAAGHGEYRPVASNEDAPGRASNRRVDIVVVTPRPVDGPTTRRAVD